MFHLNHLKCFTIYLRKAINEVFYVMEGSINFLTALRAFEVNETKKWAESTGHAENQEFIG